MSGRGRHFDVMVIGAGLSGLSVAGMLADAGARVGLVAKGGGFLHFSTGCIDVLGRGDRAGDPADAVEALVGREHRHPYARAGVASLHAGLEWFRAAMESAANPYSGDAHTALRLPTAIGSTRVTSLAPDGMTAGSLERPSPMLIVGFHGFRDFYPPYLAANLNASQRFRTRHLYLDVPQFRRRNHLLSLDVARALDQAELRTDVARMLKRDLGDAGRVGFPAVIGLAHHREAIEHLSHALERPVFEIPTLPPSVPGIRTNAVLRQRLLRAGARVEIGFWVQGHIAGNTARELVVDSAGQATIHTADAFVLATGGIGGGGIAAHADGTLRETVFGLPVEGPSNRAAWTSGTFLGSEPSTLSTIGVQVDDRLRPLSESGEPVGNVFVTASNLAHWDPVAEGSGEGVALATSRRAADGVLDILKARLPAEGRSTVHVYS